MHVFLARGVVLGDTDLEETEQIALVPVGIDEALRMARSGIVESVRGAGGGYRFTGNARRLTLMDIIELFEEVTPPAAEREGQTPVDRALGAVLAEIDENAKATFNSITLATMLGLIERQQGATAHTVNADRAR